MRRLVFLITAGVVVVVAVVAGYIVAGGGRYTAQLVMPSAAELVKGSPVWIRGRQVGTVDSLEPRNGKAILTVDLDADHAPLRAGTTSRVEWKSVLGERVVTLYPGPKSNAVIPNGGIIDAPSSQIELDQVLAALDPPTRARLSSLLQQTDGTLHGKESEVQDVLHTSGPSVQALGEVLGAVGRDGPAVHSLVSQLHEMIGTLAQRQAPIQGVVQNTSAVADSVSTEQDQLKTGLGQLPGTLAQSKAALDRVPPASEATSPLLNDLKPGTQQLPNVARNLSPVLRELRPSLAQLDPTLKAAQPLLQATPGLLDTAHGVLPQTGQALHALGPAVSFLRPYTPEAVGWLTNWSSQYSTYDSQGHMWSGVLAPGQAQVNESPVLVPPLKKPTEPKPGESAGQPWTDANGSGIR